MLHENKIKTKDVFMVMNEAFRNRNLHTTKLNYRTYQEIIKEEKSLLNMLLSAMTYRSNFTNAIEPQIELRNCTTPFGTRKVLRKENSEENREEKCKEMT